jgi:hypothetical protein
MVVVGSPSRGLVGIGRGRGDAAPVAMDSAFQRAVLSMDHVDKFEGRTLWGAGKDLRSKWGSTEVIMRGRPAGESAFTTTIWSCNSFTNLDLVSRGCRIRTGGTPYPASTLDGLRNPRLFGDHQGVEEPYADAQGGHSNFARRGEC